MSALEKQPRQRIVMKSVTPGKTTEPRPLDTITRPSSSLPHQNRPIIKYDLDRSGRLEAETPKLEDYNSGINLFDHRLLTAGEEIELAKKMEAAGVARDQMRREPPPPPEELAVLQELVQIGSDAKNTLVTCNMRLVRAVATHYEGRGLDIEDMVQEGSIGLIRAAEKFDYKKGWRFSTYATWWIRQSVTRAIMEQPDNIRRPIYVTELINNINNVSGTLYQELGREPMVSEVAAFMDLPEKKIHEMLNASSLNTRSLETAVGKSGEVKISDLVADPNAEDPHQIAEQSELEPKFKSLLESSCLTERESYVVLGRSGLAGERKTLNEIGAELGVTRERARQLEAEAVRKIRKSPYRQRVRELLS